MKWRSLELGEICSFKGGGTPKKNEPTYWIPEIPWASVKDFKSTTIDSTQDMISREGLKKSASNLIPAGSVIVPTRMALGKAAINTIDVAINQDLRALVTNGTIDSRYLLHAYTSLAHEVERHGSGATVKGITQKNLASIKIPLPFKNGKPDLDEQKRIAAILDKADAIRRKRRQALQLTDDFLRSLFLDMFGDPVTNPKGWDTANIGKSCRLVRGSSPRPKGDSRYYGGTVPRLMVADVTRDGLLVTPSIDTLTTEGAKKSRFAPAGTVVMAVSGNIGLVSQLAVDACVHDGFVAFLDLDLDQFNEKFFMLTLNLLKSTHERTKAGAIFQNITTSDIKAMDIPCPPKDKQLEFLGVWKQFEQTSKQILSLDTKSFELFSSLQQRAFMGEL